MEEEINKLIDQRFLGNSLLDWAIALGIFLVVLLLLRVIQGVGLRRVKYMAKKHKVRRVTPLLDALDRTMFLVLIVIALWAGSQELIFHKNIERSIKLVAMTAFFFQCGIWAVAYLNSWMKIYKQEKLTTNIGAVTTLNAIGISIKMVIWICVFLLLLNNFGVDITALIAGLGIGGIAIAFALQSILGDLFASFTIVVDKPFLVGDFLIIDDYLGSVEHVGMKTTRLRSLSGEQIIISNSKLLDSRIRNYGRMFERRIAVVIGTIHQITREQIKMVPQIIKEAIESQEKTRFDRAHFKSYGESSLDFEYVYYVLSPDYNIYMDVNQAINLHIHERFEKEGIDFAFPTRTVFIENAVRIEKPEEVKRSGS